MDWLRVLVGAACVAVIAAVSYYFWSEHFASQARVAAAAEYDAQMRKIALRRETERALFRAAMAETWNKDQVRQYCRNIVRIENDMTKPSSKACTELGYYP